MAAPNPNPDSVRVELNTPVQRLSLRIFSKALAQVLEYSFDNAGAGWNSLPLGGPKRQLADGVYYYVVTAEQESRTVSSQTGKLLILKN